MLFLNNPDVEKLLDMKTCLEALDVGYGDLVAGNAVHRPRIDVWAPCDRQDGYFRWGSMEGVCRTYGVFATRMKSDIVCWPEGENEIKYCIQPGTFCGLDFTLPSIQQEAAFRPFHFAGYAAGQPEELSRIPKSKVKINTEKYPILLDLLTGKVTGRTSPNQITSFINSGTQGLQFASAAGMVYRLARERGMGRELPTEWFVQDIRD